MTDTPASPAHRRPDAPDQPSTPPAHDQAPVDGDTALQLILANTAAGHTVLDLDDTPVLRAAAAATGRRYLHGRATSARRRPPSRTTDGIADFVVLTWPRPDHGELGEPGEPAPTASEVFTDVAARLRPGGHVAVLLAPTRAQAFTITWTGALLDAAADAGLTYLQDIICLHTTSPDHTDPAPHDTTGRAARAGHPRRQARTGPDRRHRTVLILRREAGRHARP